MDLYIPNSPSEFDGTSRLVPELLYSKLSLNPLESQGDFEEVIPDIMATGVLHAFPVAKFSQTLLVSRLYPGNSRTVGAGLLDLGYSDVITLSPRGTHWIESLICYMNLTRWAENLGEAEKERIVQEDSGCWTNPAIAMSFIDSLPGIRSQTDNYYEVRSKLWKSLGQIAKDPWFSALGVVWGSQPQQVLNTPDYSTLVKICPEILNRIATGIFAFQGDFEKLDHIAPWFVSQDDVFDAGYNWHSRGIVSGDLDSQSSTMLAKAYFNEGRSIPGTNPVQENAWKALGSKLSSYDGREHFEFANSISDSNPELAFVYLCNASSYYSMQRRELNEDYFELAQKLAADNDWEALKNWYSWVREIL